MNKNNKINTILLGTGSIGKVKELKKIIENYNLSNIDIKSLKDMPFSCDEPIEDGTTFLENAIIKAKYYYNVYKIPVICEDTGLCIKALNNRPGIFTARYGSVNGEHTDPLKNMERVLKELDGITDRSCKFQTAMVYFDGEILVTSLGEMKGQIADEIKGNGGFGYDPIFYVQEYNKTVGELSDEIKNKISHRFNATNHMIKQLINYKII